MSRNASETALLPPWLLTLCPPSFWSVRHPLPSMPVCSRKKLDNALYKGNAGDFLPPAVSPSPSLLHQAFVDVPGPSSSRNYVGGRKRVASLVSGFQLRTSRGRPEMRTEVRASPSAGVHGAGARAQRKPAESQLETDNINLPIDNNLPTDNNICQQTTFDDM